MHTQNASTTLVGRSIRCLLFDLGDTLWYLAEPIVLERIHWTCRRQALKHLYAHIPTDALLHINSDDLGYQIHDSILRKHYELIQLHPDQEPDPATTVQSALLDLGLPQIHPTICYDIYEAFREPITETRILFDDVLDTLQELKRRGFLLGIVSNRYHGGQPFLESMGQLGLLDYFAPDVVINSIDVGIRKPDPRIFQIAIDRLSVKATECAMIGDSLECDIAGGQALQMLTIWKTSSPTTTQKVQPDIIIKQISDLLPIFAQVECL